MKKSVLFILALALSFFTISCTTASAGDAADLSPPGIDQDTYGVTIQNVDLMSADVIVAYQPQSEAMYIVALPFNEVETAFKTIVNGMETDVGWYQCFRTTLNYDDQIVLYTDTGTYCLVSELTYPNYAELSGTDSYMLTWIDKTLITSLADHQDWYFYKQEPNCLNYNYSLNLNDQCDIVYRKARDAF